MGGNNFTELKITESLGVNKIKVIPDVLITGGNDSPNGPISGLLGLEFDLIIFVHNGLEC